MWNSKISAVNTDENGKFQSVTVSTDAGEREVIADGLFVSIGRDPETSLFGELAQDGGYILAGEDTLTSVAGAFAAGDVRTKPFRQIVTAAADGAVAAQAAEKYLASLER
jgi:thioredoxin reductase (NADPH)